MSETKDETTFNEDFDFDLKSKRRKKKAFNLEELEKELPAIETKEDTSESSDKKESVSADFEANIDFNLLKKKKKKKAIVFEDSGANEEDKIGEQAEDAPTCETVNAGTVDRSAWLNSDEDYTYDELLSRIYQEILAKNPDIAGEKKRLKIQPPQVLKVGTKKTSFANFLDICKSLHRQPRHMQAFLLVELGTSGSVDANNQLIIKGKFQQKQIENVLRRYIKEYVACQTCRSPETILQKDTRLFFLQCETCGSRRSVTSIKSGFQAVTGKRAAIRAKTA